MPRRLLAGIADGQEGDRLLDQRGIETGRQGFLTGDPDIDALLGDPKFAGLHGGAQDRGNGLFAHIDRCVLLFLLENAPLERWERDVLEIIREEAYYFVPQMQTKIMNEGWASYWHEHLFLQDDRIKGHEVDFARVHAGVTSMPRVGMNPYALGMRLLNHIEEQADKGRLSFAFQRLLDADQRKRFDSGVATGHDFIFTVRENLCDYLFLKDYLDQDFMERHKLFVAGKRLDQQRMVWQYYVKSRKAEEYRQMMLDSLYHPPVITVDQTRGIEGSLYLMHTFEGKQLVREYVANTLLGIEYLWGSPVYLETSEAEVAAAPSTARQEEPSEEEITWQRVLYSMNEKVLSKKKL